MLRNKAHGLGVKIFVTADNKFAIASDHATIESIIDMLRAKTDAPA